MGEQSNWRELSNSVEVKNKEKQPLLCSTSRLSCGHHRSVSYGSFLPTFTVDVAYLRNLLPEEAEPDINDGANTTTEDEVGGVSSVKTKEERKQPRTVQRDYSRIDSLIESNLSPIVTETFLTALENQLETLFTFFSLHLSQVKEEMATFELKQDLNHVNDHGSATNTDDEDFDKVSIGGDSGIEDDHLSSPKGFLTRIRDVLRNMKQSLNSSIQQLDEMVGVYDHHTGDDTAHCLLQKHHPQHVQLHDDLDRYISRIDTKLSKFTTDDNMDKINEYQTLEKAKKEKLSLFHILALLLLVASASFLIYFSVAYPTSRWIILLRLLRSPFTVVFYLYLLGMNMMTWARFGINYISMFNFPRSSSPTPKYMFHIASMFSILFTLMTVICLLLGTDVLFILDKVTGFLMWGCILLFWINPLDILHRTGRFSFLLVFVRITIAPFPIVTFADFWFADQLNSLLALILDIQYLACYSFQSNSWNGSVLELKSCTTASNGIRPIISSLPAFWRFLQCLRCYQKTKKVAHLFNAAKYFTTFPVVIFATFFAVAVKPFRSLDDINLQETGWMIIGWLVSSLVHALYCFYWDIVMDWGLIQVGKGTFLRPTVYYRKWTYLIAISIDFVIRFACAAKLTLAIVYHIDSDVIYTVLILSEVLRRVLWNFFRIEYEQVLKSS